MKLRFGSRFKGSRVLRFRFASDGIFDKVWIAGCHPCVSGILPRPDLHEAEVDSPRDPENRGWNPLTQKDEMEPGSSFSIRLTIFPVRNGAYIGFGVQGSEPLFLSSEPWSLFLSGNL